MRTVLALTAALAMVAPARAADPLGIGDSAPTLAVKAFIKGEAVKGFEKGKVYVVEFWATWCGPCKEEMPNVRRVYEAYHDKGFEVVAVSLDSEKDKQKLLDYCRANNLPWPQFFDGKGWKNEFAVKYSINAIPAMFLLDQDGKVVTTEARGEKLETEVKRLLKQ